MRFFVLLLSLIAAAPAAAQLSGEEQAMVSAVDADRGHVEDFLERFVNQNSGSLNLEGVRAAAEIVRPEFEALGFDVEWVDMTETGRAGHLVMTHKGSGKGKRLLMIGHLDTVFEPGSGFDGFTRDPKDANRATGPGIGDNKGGVAVILASLRAMASAGTLDGADIKVVLTGDEERSGSPIAIARRDLIDAGKWADVALGFEGLVSENGEDFGTIARRSSSSWTLRTTGTQAHSSGIFGDPGYGAIYEMVRILDAWRADLREPNLTYNVGFIGGGTTADMDAAGLSASSSGKTNIISQTAVARGDLRSLTREQDERARKRMAEIVALHLPGTSAELEWEEGGYPPMSPRPENLELLKEFSATSVDLGMGPLGVWDPARRGAADISFVADDVDAALAGLGADGSGAHAPGEAIDLSSIPKQAKRVAVFMTRLSRQPR